MTGGKCGLFYGKVIGTVVCTTKDEKLKGKKLLVVQRVNYDGENEGSPIIALDAAQAGIGDFVMLAKGREASLPFGDMEHPTDASIVGIIDKVNIKKFS